MTGDGQDNWTCQAASPKGPSRRRHGYVVSLCCGGYFQLFARKACDLSTAKRQQRILQAATTWWFSRWYRIADILSMVFNRRYWRYWKQVQHHAFKMWNRLSNYPVTPCCILSFLSSSLSIFPTQEVRRAVNAKRGAMLELGQVFAETMEAKVEDPGESGGIQGCQVHTSSPGLLGLQLLHWLLGKRIIIITCISFVSGAVTCWDFVNIL